MLATLPESSKRSNLTTSSSLFVTLRPSPSRYCWAVVGVPSASRLRTMTLPPSYATVSAAAGSPIRIHVGTQAEVSLSTMETTEARKLSLGTAMRGAFPPGRV